LSITFDKMIMKKYKISKPIGKIKMSN